MTSTIEQYRLTIPEVQHILSAHFHCTLVFIFCHAIHTCVYFVALYYIATNKGSRRTRIVFGGIITFLWCAETVIVALQWTILDDIFINQGGSFDSEFDTLMFGEEAGGLAGSVLRSLNVALADLVLIWRCWVLYGRSWKAAGAPAICLIAELVACGIVIAGLAKQSGAILDAQVNWVLLYYSMIVVTNSLCTILILTRIVRTSDNLKTYRGVIEIIVESAVMYSIIYIALVVVYGYEYYSPRVKVMGAYAYPLLMSYSISGIAPTLIIARVMAGHSRPDTLWTRPSLPHLTTDVRSLNESFHCADAPPRSSTTVNLEDARGDFREDSGAFIYQEKPFQVRMLAHDKV
ncbi:hypothetical protein CPB85DRAFT_844423 [Mucidula mucida]|nr:hypothetical protein CPB85DRAFT_844423 [Mucidula mucida]